MFQLRMLHDIFRRCHNFRHAGLVIRPQKGSPIRSNQRMPLEKRQFREISHPHGQLFIQTDILAVIIFYHLGLDICPTHVRTGIHMGYKANDRAVLTSRCGRYRAHGIPVGIHLHLCQAHRFHFLCQVVQQNQLLCSRGISFTFRVALRVKTDIFQKTLF